MESLGGHCLHGLPHQRVNIKDGVEVVDAQREDVAVSFGANGRDAPRVRQQANLAKVGSVAEAGGHVARGQDDVDDALLNEVHLVTDGALLDDNIAGLEDFVLELRDDRGDEIGVGVGEEGHGGHQRPAVEVDDVFFELLRKFAENFVLVEEFSLISMLEILCDSLSHFSGQFSVGHVLFHLLDFFAVLTPGRIEALDEIRGVSEEHGVTRGAADHGQHGEPHVGEALRREAAVADAQHVGHGLE